MAVTVRHVTLLTPVTVAMAIVLAQVTALAAGLMMVRHGNVIRSRVVADVILAQVARPGDLDVSVRMKSVVTGLVARIVGTIHYPAIPIKESCNLYALTSLTF